MSEAITAIFPIKARPGRIAAVDALRGLALIAMATYHGAWDLMYQGYLRVDVTAEPHWRGFAIGIATTFLFLVGVSLVLASGGGTTKALKRVAKIAVGAALVSAVTFYLFADEWIFFGVLHHIALASLLGLGLLRLPSLVLGLLAVAALVVPGYVAIAAFSPRYLAWTGLGAMPPPSNDFIPLLPWIAVVIAGMLAARVCWTTGVLAKIAAWRLPAPLGGLAFFGRHSLIFYLVHQPVLFGLVAGLAYLAPPPRADALDHFSERCTQSCMAGGGTACATVCACTQDHLRRADFPRRFPSMTGNEAFSEVQQAADLCRAAGSR